MSKYPSFHNTIVLITGASSGIGRCAALDFARKNGKTQGRARILQLGLDSETIAGRLIDIYEGLQKTKLDVVTH